MPIYDYRCDHCGHAFSAVQSFKDEPLGVCPSCGKRPRRLFALPALVFKGSGWYKTDSRSSSAAKDGPGDKSGAKTDAKAESASEGKTGDKSAAKTGEAAS